MIQERKTPEGMVCVRSCDVLDLGATPAERRNRYDRLVKHIIDGWGRDDWALFGFFKSHFATNKFPLPFKPSEIRLEERNGLKFFLLTVPRRGFHSEGSVVSMPVPVLFQGHAFLFPVVIVAEQETEDEREKVLAHELVHLKQLLDCKNTMFRTRSEVIAEDLRGGVALEIPSDLTQEERGTAGEIARRKFLQRLYEEGDAMSRVDYPDLLSRNEDWEYQGQRRFDFLRVVGEQVAKIRVCFLDPAGIDWLPWIASLEEPLNRMGRDFLFFRAIHCRERVFSLFHILSSINAGAGRIKNLGLPVVLFTEFTCHLSRVGGFAFYSQDEAERAIAAWPNRNPPRLHDFYVLPVCAQGGPDGLEITLKSYCVWREGMARDIRTAIVQFYDTANVAIDSYSMEDTKPLLEDKPITHEIGFRARFPGYGQYRFDLISREARKDMFLASDYMSVISGPDSKPQIKMGIIGRDQWAV